MTPPDTTVIKVLTSITVAVGSGTIQVGQTTTATASGLDQTGAAISTGAVTWTSSSTSVATVNSNTGIVTAVAPGQAQITGTAGGKQATASVTVIAVPVSGKYRIVFARGSKCYREDASGCDLYFTDVDMATKTVITPVTAIAEVAGVAEFFPGLSSSGRFVVYNRIVLDQRGIQVSNDVWAADLTKKGSAALLIADARFPQISSDDKKLYFSRPGKPRDDLYVSALTINESAGTISVGNLTNLTGTITSFAKAEDPFPIGLSSQLAFHYQVTETTPSVVAVLDAATGTYVNISDGSGHASVSSIGTIVSSSLGGTGLSVATAKTGGWNAAQIATLPGQSSTLASLDTAYSNSNSTSKRDISRWSYPEWMDDGHVIASVMAGTVVSGGNVYTMSRLFLVTLNGGTFELLTTLLGGVYADYCTVATRALK